MAYFDEFRIYESTNFVREKCLVFFYRSYNVSFFLRKNQFYLATFLISIEKFYLGLKENKKNFVKKIVDS
jgi:hypothetical protein